MRLALISLVAALVFAAPASASSSADALLTNLAGHQIHGWTDTSLTVDQLDTKVNRGETIYVPCGTTNILAQKIMTRAGYKSRLVQGIAAEYPSDMPPGTAETHVMLEIWYGYWGWVLYDVDENVQPVDENNNPISAAKFFSMTERHYRVLATDPIHDMTGSRFPAYEQRIYEDFEAFRDRVSATLAIRPPGTTLYYYSDQTENPIVAGWSSTGYRPQSPAVWAAFLAGSPGTPLPVSQPAPAPATAPRTTVAPALTSTPAVTAPAKPEPKLRKCRHLKRRYLRTRTRTARHRYRACRAHNRRVRNA